MILRSERMIILDEEERKRRRVIAGKLRHWARVIEHASSIDIRDFPVRKEGEVTFDLAVYGKLPADVYEACQDKYIDEMISEKGDSYDR
jgi:hypothetical protein